MHSQICDGSELDFEIMSQREQLAQSHFRAQCPCALQLAIALSLVTNDGRLHHDGGQRSLSSDLGIVPEFGTSPPDSHGQGLTSGTQSKPTEKSKKRRRTQGKGQTPGPDGPGSHGPDPDPDGQTPHTTGQRNPGPSSRGHIHLLFQQQRAGRVAEVPSDNSGEVALLGQSNTQANTLDSVATETDSGALWGPPDTPDSTWRGPAGVSTEESGATEPGPPAGYDVSLLGMGQPSQEAPDQPTQTTLSGQDDPERPGDAGHVRRDRAYQELPCAPNIGTHHALEAAPEHTGRQRIWPDANLLRIERVGADGNQLENAHSVPEWVSNSVGEAASPSAEGQGQGQEAHAISSLTAADRSRLLNIVAHAKFVNPNNWCFGNSTVIALLWCTLTVRDFSSMSWGHQCNTLLNFVETLATGDGVLSTQSWFSHVLQVWGRSEIAQLQVSISQHDAAEFVSQWLDVMQSDEFNMSWDRRIEHENGTHVVDHSSFSLPLFLQFDRTLADQPLCDLNAIINYWHQVDGMVAALTSHSKCLCIHVDRCIQVPGGDTVIKCQTAIHAEVTCSIPVFTDESITFEYQTYSVAALQAHLGGDAHGHYRTALRIHPTVTNSTQPAHWLLCDDWRCPQPVWQLPGWFSSNITLIWLIRADYVLLHKYQDRPTMTGTTELVEAMLALLPLHPRDDDDEARALDRV